MSGELDEARRYLAEIPEQASAAALVSIAESLHILARAVTTLYGVCPDCGHEWRTHTTQHPKGCQATVSSRGVASTCPCTEPRFTL